MNAISSGEWNFYSDKKEFQPNDQQSKNLFDIISNIDSYESKRTKSNIQPEPIKLPVGGQWSTASIASYYHNILGVNLTDRGFAINRWVDFKYPKDSSTVLELFKNYPLLKKYWDIFESMGFKVSCALLDLDDIRKNYNANIKSVDETIILWVSTG